MSDNNSLPQELARKLPPEYLPLPGATWQRLSGGRVNEVWHIFWPGQSIVFKRYASDGNSPLFRNDCQAEAMVLDHLKRYKIAPRLLAAHISPDFSGLVYAHVGGTPWHTKSDVAAKTLHRLHACSRPGNLPVKPSGSAAITAQTNSILSECSLRPARQIAHMMPVQFVRPVSDLVLLHGDPVPANILVGPDGPALIDWQCPAVGEPAEDHAMFLSPAMHLLYRGEVLPDSEIRRYLRTLPIAVSTRYLALKPWFHWRMSAYCLWKSEKGAADYSPAMEAELASLRQSAIASQ